VRRLDAEDPRVPTRVMAKANILDFEISLSLFPFPGPGQMRLVELLTKSGNLDLVRLREKNLKHGDTASPSATPIASFIELAIDEGFGKAT
jgi:hypothetical protein